MGDSVTGGTRIVYASNAKATGARLGSLLSSSWSRRIEPTMFATLVVLALAAGLMRRLLVGWDAPLWLDEAWTGSIAAQSTFRAFVELCLKEVNPPLYYLMIWGWSKIAGLSDVALRLPSLVFALLAPLLILLRGHAEPRTRSLWAAFAAVWLPSFWFASEARAYSLLFLLACGQAIAFPTLLRAPSLGRAAAWCGLSALMILTHYHAGFIVAVQGLAYLIIHRGAALRTWPAALIFVPVIVWMGVHLPLALRFSDPDVAWYGVLGPADLIGMPRLLFGAGRTADALALLAGAALAVEVYRLAVGKAGAGRDLASIVTALSGLIAFSLVFGMGFLRPSFTSRYLVPFMPALLLGLALLVRAWDARWRGVASGVLAVLIGLCLWNTARGLAEPMTDHRYKYSYELASHYLRSKDVRRVVFLWDNPTATAVDRAQLASLGGFFFQRAGAAIPVSPIVLGTPTDPNETLVEAASVQGSGILWLFDRNVRKTVAVRYPPRIEQIDPRWSCKDFGKRPVSILACVRSTAPAGSRSLSRLSATSGSAGR